MLLFFLLLHQYSEEMSLVCLKHLSFPSIDPHGTPTRKQERHADTLTWWLIGMLARFLASNWLARALVSQERSLYSTVQSCRHSHNWEPGSFTKCLWDDLGKLIRLGLLFFVFNKHRDGSVFPNQSWLHFRVPIDLVSHTYTVSNVLCLIHIQYQTSCVSYTVSNILCLIHIVSNILEWSWPK